MSQQLIGIKNRSVRFYACGGQSTNMLRRYRENQALETAAIRAQEHYSFIDTSIANLQNVAVEETFLVTRPDGGEIDGSGSDRRANAEAIMASLPSILIQHPPADLNVVCFSAAGGSGSVCAPLLLERLLAEGQTVVAVVTGDHSSLKRTTNTISTLQGLEAAVQRLGRPIVIYYKDNDPTKSHSENDIVPQFVMSMLSVLGSGKNAHLDTADIRNMFDFHKVTHHKPCLAMLDVFAREEDLAEVKHAVSYASLLRDSESLVPVVPCDYDKAGVLPESTAPHRSSFYFTVTIDRLSGIFKGLLEKKSLADKQRQVNTHTTSLLGNNTQVSDLGLVFD